MFFLSLFPSLSFSIFPYSIPAVPYHTTRPARCESTEEGYAPDRVVPQTPPEPGHARPTSTRLHRLTDETEGTAVLALVGGDQRRPSGPRLPDVPPLLYNYSPLPLHIQNYSPSPLWEWHNQNNNNQKHAQYVTYKWLYPFKNSPLYPHTHKNTHR